MRRRHALACTALAAFAALAGCAPKPPEFSYPGSGAPLWNALNTSQRNLSDLSQYAGKPADAARALAQYEYILDRIGGGGDGAGIPLASQGVIQGGDGEIRRALGIAPGTSFGQLAGALQGYADLASTGQSAAALAALGAPPFTRGGPATLATLTNLPHMPSVQNGSYALQRAAGNIVAR